MYSVYSLNKGYQYLNAKTGQLIGKVRVSDIQQSTFFVSIYFLNFLITFILKINTSNEMRYLILHVPPSSLQILSTALVVL